MAEAGELVVKITADSTGFQKEMTKATKTADTSMSSIAKSIASAASSWKLFEGLGKGIEFNKAAEQAQVSFEVMTGSIETATETLKQLKEFANSTPLEYKDIRDATQNLLLYGISAQEAVPFIKQLGDVSGGNAEKLNQLSIAFGRATAMGKLTGETMQMMVTAGFNPLQEISRTTGESMESLQKRLADGSVSVDEMNEAFRSATSAGGLFYQMLERQSQTLTGKISTMNDAIETGLGKMTEAFSGPMMIGAEVATALANAFAEMPPGIQAATGTIVALGAALLAAIPAAKTFGIQLSASFGPIGLAAAAAAAAIVGVIAQLDAAKKAVEEDAKNNYMVNVAEAFGKTGQEAEKANEHLALFLRNLAKNRLTPEMAAVPGFFESVAKNAGVSTAVLAEGIIRSNQFSKEIKKIAEGYRDQNAAAQEVANRQKEIENRWKVHTKEIQNNTAATKLSKEEIEKLAKAQEKAYEGAISTVMELGAESDKVRQQQIENDEKAIDSVWKLSQETDKALEEKYRNTLAAEDHITSLIEDSNEEREQNTKNSAKKMAESIAGAAQTVGNVLGSIIGSLNTIFQNNAEDMIDTIEGIYDGQIEGIENALKTELDAIETSDSARKKAHEAEMERIDEQRQALEDQYEADIERVDAELQAQLEALGLAEETKIEKLTRERDEAIASGDTELAAEKERDLQRQTLIDAAEAKKKALEDTKKAEAEKLDALEKQRIKDNKKLEEQAVADKAKAEKLAADEIAKAQIQKEREVAKVKYAADMAAYNSQLAMAIVNAAQAIIMGFAQLGPIGGAIAAVTTGIATGFQIAAIASNKPKMPAFAAGTDFAPGGMALVGERGPELVNIPRGSQVFTAGETQDIMRRGGSGVQVVVNNYSPIALDPAESARMTSRSMRELAFQGAF